MVVIIDAAYYISPKSLVEKNLNYLNISVIPINDKRFAPVVDNQLQVCTDSQKANGALKEQRSMEKFRRRA